MVSADEVLSTRTGSIHTLGTTVAQVDVLRDDVVVVGVQMRVVHVHNVPVDQNLAQTDQFTGEVQCRFPRRQTQALVNVFAFGVPA